MSTQIATEGASTLGALLLGILQGLTEFLPVSSSGHLVLFQQFLDVVGDDVAFDLILHLGTLIPVLWFYRQNFVTMFRDIVQGEGAFFSRPGTRLLCLLAVASVPTAMIGLGLKDTFESLFSNPSALVVTFSITGILLLLSGRAKLGTTTVGGIRWRDAIILGIAQGLAITPGISRSGTTITVALLLGIEREAAARFSFLMSVPAILGAVALKASEASFSGMDSAQLGVGAIAAMVSGYFALVMLVHVVKNGKFQHFAWYCFFAAAVAGYLSIS